ncbi:hypothetical protein A3SI_13874 [Nitritalea halalkaliphila LW7]|uniref:Uncharacterized protein n=1 Tax=Nitritalea halalkaliphila LW7 TaxID=1189621 RepID=I5C071_9BACT|nr:ferrous iron transport protein A [Nitritalea halalkaliphila]EIM75223.1 hypothetical protein A3SI_13874 [Nitritalea halalkaliphila LW7]
MSSTFLSAAEMPREQEFRISALHTSPIQVQLQALGVLVGKPIRLLQQALSGVPWPFRWEAHASASERKKQPPSP